MPLLIEMYKRFGCTIYMGVHRTAGICVRVQCTCLPVVHVHRTAGTCVGVHVPPSAPSHTAPQVQRALSVD